jgi:hypothetical protein
MAYEALEENMNWNGGNALREKFAIVHNWLFLGPMEAD